MIRCLALLFICLVFFGRSHLKGQENKVSVSFGSFTYEEFSFKPDIQNTTNPHFTDFNIYRDSTGERIINFPLSFTTRVEVIGVKKNSGLRFDYSLYMVGFRPERIGRTFYRSHHSLSIQYVNSIFQSYDSTWIINGFFGPRFRLGRETYITERSGQITDVHSERLMRDLSLEAGLSFKRALSNKVYLGIDLSLSRWVFLYTNHVLYDGSPRSKLKRKPENQIDFALRLEVFLN